MKYLIPILAVALIISIIVINKPEQKRKALIEQKIKNRQEEFFKLRDSKAWEYMGAAYHDTVSKWAKEIDSLKMELTKD